MDWLSRGKSLNLAALIFLLFAMVWLAIAAAGASGMALADGGQVTAFLQGILALASACLVVSRLKTAPLGVLCLAGGILLAPALTGGWEASRQAEAQQQKLQADSELIAQQLALPDPLRNEEGKLRANEAHQQGYLDPPSLQEELRERQERVSLWIDGHRAQVSQILRSMPGQSPPPMASLSQRVKAGLAVYKGGKDWTWLEAFLQKARQAGLDDAPRPFSTEQQRAALEHARQWLRTHPPQAGLMPYQNLNAPPDPQAQFDQARRGAVSLMGVWVILPALWAMWLGRDSFTRPLEPARVPGWVFTGMLGLMRSDPGAPYRVLGGLALLLTGVLLTALLRWRGLPGAKAMAIFTVVVGGGLLVTGLNLNDEADP